MKELMNLEGNSKGLWAPYSISPVAPGEWAVGHWSIPQRHPSTGSSPAISVDPAQVRLCLLSFAVIKVNSYGNHLEDLSLLHPEVIIASFLSSFNQIGTSVVYLTVLSPVFTSHFCMGISCTLHFQWLPSTALSGWTRGSHCTLGGHLHKLPCAHHPLLNIGFC